MAESVHVPVLCEQVVSMLKAAESGCFLDCTLGGGGHTAALLDAHRDNRVMAIDRDPRAIERSAWLQSKYQARFSIKQGTFSQISSLYPGERFDGILADLGVSTDQLKEERGFSFNDSVDLDMRMNPSEGESAAELLERVSAQELFVILRQGGVGPEARQVAAAIIRERPFTSAQHFAEFLANLSILKAKKKKSHPATVIFQALRIAVNREIEEIEALMAQAPQVTKSGGRLAVITFHSLEDTIVTRQMRAWENQGSAPAGYRGVRAEPRLGKVITRKPITASDAEVEINPASRSASLRVFEFAV